VTDYNVVAYLGMPLAIRSGVIIGSFCVIDTEPRHWTIDDYEVMAGLAASVVSEINLRSAAGTIERLQTAIHRERSLLHATRRLSELSALMLRSSEAHTADWQLAINETLAAAADAVRQAVELGSTGANGEQPDRPGNLLREKLSSRQRQVFDLLMRGLQTKEIAQQLDISPRTVEVHRAKILERLQMSSFQQLLKQLLASAPPP
jgi:DNA-binding NarL/FixJ family response regulator